MTPLVTPSLPSLWMEMQWDSPGERRWVCLNRNSGRASAYFRLRNLVSTTDEVIHAREKHCDKVVNLIIGVQREKSPSLPLFPLSLCSLSPSVPSLPLFPLSLCSLSPSVPSLPLFPLSLCSLSPSVPSLERIHIAASNEILPFNNYH